MRLPLGTQITLTVNPACRYGVSLTDAEWSVEHGFGEELEARIRTDTCEEMYLAYIDESGSTGSHCKWRLEVVHARVRACPLFTLGGDV